MTRTRSSTSDLDVVCVGRGILISVHERDCLGLNETVDTSAEFTIIFLIFDCVLNNKKKFRASWIPLLNSTSKTLLSNLMLNIIISRCRVSWTFRADFSAYQFSWPHKFSVEQRSGADRYQTVTTYHGLYILM